MTVCSEQARSDPLPRFVLEEAMDGWRSWRMKARLPGDVVAIRPLDFDDLDIRYQDGAQRRR
jgi:hypothetical protein